ncbi:putative phage tail protein [Sporosarcina sp. NCCP-2222]|uniref:putative phage tail protein n=1 Tax=Sporosarcina sp. NCCP-2222 TaxID=2935073 RepID=UPI0024A62E49|nr:putative phage tail protein [Sporosarcina sp. NCCP-2222]
MESVTPVYDKDELALAVFEANGRVMDEITKVIKNLKHEMYPQHATWTVGYWESMLGIKTNKNLSDAERIQKVLFELNKYFPITRNRMEQIVNVHVQNRNAKVIEDRGEYSFTIEIPSENVIITADIHRDVEEAKPAHLAYMISILAERVTGIIKTKQYTFNVPYPVTGTFRTAPINGIASKATAAAESKTYANPVPYPVTGTFVARDEPFVRLEGKAEDLRLERVDLWENRNLLLNSGFHSDLVYWANWGGDTVNRGVVDGKLGKKWVRLTSSGVGSFRGVSQVINSFEPNTEYTISFLAYAVTGPSVNFLIHQAGGGNNNPQIGTIITPISTEPKEISYTFRSVDDTSKGRFNFMIGGSYTSPFDIYIADIKFEKGSSSTQWQPAPQDGIVWYHPETIKLLEIDLYKSGTYLNSKFTWTEETPPGTSAIVEYSFDKVNWSKLTNGGSLPLKKYSSLVGKQLYIRQVLTTTDQRITPAIRNFKYVINDKEAIV